MSREPTKIVNLDLSYPADLAADIALVWIGCHYAAWTLALLPFSLGLLIIVLAVVTPNVQAYFQWRQEKAETPRTPPTGGTYGES